MHPLTIHMWPCRYSMYVYMSMYGLVIYGLYEYYMWVIRVISIHHLWCLRCERIWAAFIQQCRPQNWLVKNGIPCSWSSWNMIIWHYMGWWRDFPWHWWWIVWIMNDHDNPRTNMYTLHMCSSIYITYITSQTYIYTLSKEV